MRGHLEHRIEIGGIEHRVQPSIELLNGGCLHLRPPGLRHWREAALQQPEKRLSLALGLAERVKVVVACLMQPRRFFARRGERL